MFRFIFNVDWSYIARRRIHIVKGDTNGNFKLGLWNSLIKLQRILLFITSICVVLCIGFLVIFRYVFKIDLFGMEEIVIVFAFWLYFIGGSFATYKRNHISVDIVTAFMKKARQVDLFKLVVSFITFVLCLILTYHGFIMFVWGLTHIAKTAVWQIPWYIPQSSIFVGYFLMSFYFIVYFMIDLKKYNSKYKKH